VALVRGVDRKLGPRGLAGIGATEEGVVVESVERGHKWRRRKRKGRRVNIVWQTLNIRNNGGERVEKQTRKLLGNGLV